jgi:hypothetical protein
MEASRTRFVLLVGGKAPGAPSGRPRAKGALRLIEGGRPEELESALAEAIEAARQMRLEIQRRIASALEAFEDRG